MATNGRNRRLEPFFKQHTAVDDVSGVVTGEAIVTVTADAGYAYGKIYGGLERRRS